MFFFYFFIFLFLTTIKSNFDGNSFSGNLEIKINEVPCVRIFSSKGSIGCGTLKEETIGALYEIRSLNDIKNIKDIKVDFSLLLSAKYFISDLISILNKYQPQGVIIYDGNWLPDEESTEKYSTDMNTTQGDGTPQSDLTFNSNYQWNNYGNGIMYQSLPYEVLPFFLFDFFL